MITAEVAVAFQSWSNKHNDQKPNQWAWMAEPQEWKTWVQISVHNPLSEGGKKTSFEFLANF